MKTIVYVSILFASYSDTLHINKNQHWNSYNDITVESLI